MSPHWVLTTWSAKSVAGSPAFIVAPRARCALWSRKMAVHLTVRSKGARWIGIDSSERRDGGVHDQFGPGDAIQAAKNHPARSSGRGRRGAVNELIRRHRRASPNFGAPLA